jgi:hypothetical protein
VLRQLQLSQRTATRKRHSARAGQAAAAASAAGTARRSVDLWLCLVGGRASEHLHFTQVAHAHFIHTFFLVALSRQAGAGMAGPVSPGGPASSLPLESSALEAAWPGASPQCASMNSMYSLLLSIRGPRMRTRSSEPMTSFSRSAWRHRKGHGRGVQPRRSAQLLQASRVRAALRAPRRARGALPCAPRAG